MLPTSLDARRKRYLQFSKMFPAYNDGISLAAYLHDIVLKALMCGCYVPPPSTVREDNLDGVLLQDLPVSIKVERDIMASTLSQCLRSAASKLSEGHSFKTIVDQHEDGFEAWYDLCHLLGQPVINEYLEPPLAPHQRADETLMTHAKRFCQYAYEMILHGIFLSDRWFVICFARTAHASLRSDAVLQTLLREIELVDINKPLPPVYGPTRLASRLLSLADGLRCANILRKTPRELMKSGSANGALIRDLQVAALRGEPGKGRQCHLCKGEDHIVGPACPVLTKIKSNDAATRSLIYWLKKDSPTSRPKEQPKMIRQLSTDLASALADEVDDSMEDIDEGVDDDAEVPSADEESSTASSDFR